MIIYKMDIRIVVLVTALIAVGLVNGKRKYITYTVNNVLLQPNFHESIQLKLKKGKNLLFYMEKACMQDPDRFTNFTATFKPKIFGGYFIDAINGAAGNYPVNKTFWQIDNADGPIKFGVSKYIPKPRDEILFNLTRWTGTHP